MKNDVELVEIGVTYSYDYGKDAVDLNDLVCALDLKNTGDVGPGYIEFLYTTADEFLDAHADMCVKIDRIIENLKEVLKIKRRLLPKE